MNLQQKLRQDAQLRVEELEETLLEKDQELHRLDDTVVRLQGEVRRHTWTHLYTTQPLHYTPLHYTPVYYTPVHYTPVHICTLDTCTRLYTTHLYTTVHTCTRHNCTHLYKTHS